MDDETEPTRRVSDYNDVFVKLTEQDPQIVHAIEVLGALVADLPSSEDASVDLDQVGATGFVTALA